MDKHNCDNINCNHNNTKGLCCLFNPDNCKYRQLQKENAELKEQQFSLRNERNTFLTQNEQYEKDLIDFNEKLTKAKELLKKIYNFEYGIEADFPKFDLVKWAIETRNFLKDSEVEK